MRKQKHELINRLPNRQINGVGPPTGTHVNATHLTKVGNLTWND